MEGIGAGGFLVTFVWILFAAAIALSIGLGAILMYHWTRFAMNSVVPAIALIVYGSGCALFIFVMFGAALAM